MTGFHVIHDFTIRILSGLSVSFFFFLKEFKLSKFKLQRVAIEFKLQRVV